MANPYPARIAFPDPITPVFYLGLIASGQKPPVTGFGDVDPVFEVSAFFDEDSNDGTQYVAVSEDGSGNVVGISSGGLSISGWEVFHVGGYVQSASFGRGAIATNGEVFTIIGLGESDLGLETYQTIRMPYGEYNSNVTTEVGSSLIPREDVIDWGNDPSSPYNQVIMVGAFAPRTAGGLPQALFPLRKRASSDPYGFNNRLIGVLAGPFETTAVTIAETTDSTYNIFGFSFEACIVPAPHNAIYSGMLVTIDTSTAWDNEGGVQELTYVQFKTTPLYSSVGVPGDADCELFEPFIQYDGDNIAASDIADLGQWRSLGDGFIADNPDSTGELSDKSWIYVNRDWTVYQVIRLYGLDTTTCAMFTEDDLAIYDRLQKDASGNWFVLGYVTADDEDIILKEGIPDPETPFECPSTTGPPGGYNPGNAGNPGGTVVVPGIPPYRPRQMFLGLSAVPEIVLDPTDPNVPFILLSGEGISTTEIELIFTELLDVTGYEYRLNGGTVLEMPSDKILEDLKPNTDYIVEIRGVSILGVGPWSNPVEVTTWEPI